jgi:hypothetical protein
MKKIFCVNHAQKQKIKNICRILMVVAIVNFVFLFVIALFIGGDAINGKESAGQYYLANHGKLTEVSYHVFIYSKIHVITVFITHPLGMAASFLYMIAGGKKDNLWTF